MVGGHPMTPAGIEGEARLKKYWLAGPGRARWDYPPHPWTNLYHHLRKYIPGFAKQTAAKWFHEAKGYWPGSDINRVANGSPPRGKKIGPG